jgi:hypothetical protein
VERNQQVKPTLKSVRWKGLLAALVMAFATSGCAHYDITLTNGTVIQTKSKPKLQEGFYVYKNFRGEVERVRSTRVRQIEPTRHGKQSPFIPTS